MVEKGKSVEEAGTLVSLARDLFVEQFDQIRFGPCIEGAVFELTLSKRPILFSVLDGYLTVGLPHGRDHFHLCLGETRGLGKRGTPAETARIRASPICHG